MKRADFHVHTGTVSSCANRMATAEGYIDICVQENISTIGFSDHLWDPDISKARSYPKDVFERLNNLYNSIPKDTKGVKVFVGCETDMDVYGRIGITKEHASELDYVLIPISHYHNPDVKFLGIDVNDAKFMPKFAIDRFIKACDSDFSVPTGICHPFVPYGTELRDELVQELSDIDLLECFKYAAQKNILIEIHSACNPSRWKQTENGFSVQYTRMITFAKEAGCRFYFGSDAHSYKDFASDVHNKQIEFAKYCGITEDKIVTEFNKNNKNF